MPGAMPTALKLRAGDAEDLAILSAVLQDALVTVGDMKYLPEERRFVLVANRFRWEASATAEPERIFSGLCVDRIAALRRRGFDPHDGDRLLCLLAIRAVEGEPGTGISLYLDFAGGSSIRLDVEEILCHLEDIGEPWPTRWRPRHPLEETR